MMKLKLFLSATLLFVALLLLTTAVKAQTNNSTNTAAAGTTIEKLKGDEKLKELPEPDKIGWRRDRRLGKKLYKRGGIENGLRYFQEAINKKPKRTKLWKFLADGYFMVRDYRTSNKYYNLLADQDSVKHKNLYSLYRYALTDKYLGNYDKSKENFNKYITAAKSIESLSGERKNAALEIEGCDLGNKLLKSTDLRTYKIAHLDSGINQPLTDFSPVLKDANTLYLGKWVSDDVILQNKHEKYATLSRIYEAKRNDNKWQKAEVVKGGINEVSFHTGNPTFTQDGKTMFFTQCYQDDYQRMFCNIYKSTKNNDGWSTGEQLDANVNAAGFTNTQPAVGKNENGEDVLYFASNRNEGRGMDLFSAKLNSDGTVGKAKALGVPVNTNGDEKTPFYDFNSNTLYFSSSGHVNIGGEDVFKTKAAKGEWTQPENLGLPVNSSVDDEYFNWYEKSGIGFVVSNRPGGYGLKSETCCDDVYELTLNKIYPAIKGKLLNADSATVSVNGVTITLFDETTGKEIKTITSIDGLYFFDLDGEKNYAITAKKEGFEDYVKKYSTIGFRTSDTASFNFMLKEIPKPKIKAGDLISLVNWDFDRDILTASAPDSLGKIVSFITANPQFVIEVGSHTDSKGSDEYNLKLSQRRSDRVMKYLQSKNIENAHLLSKAYGESKPVAPNTNTDGSDNEAGRAQNRRTEFRVAFDLNNKEEADSYNNLLNEQEKTESKKHPVKKAAAK